MRNIVHTSENQKVDLQLCGQVIHMLANDPTNLHLFLVASM